MPYEVIIRQWLVSSAGYDEEDMVKWHLVEIVSPVNIALVKLVLQLIVSTTQQRVSK